VGRVNAEESSPVSPGNAFMGLGGHLTASHTEERSYDKPRGAPTNLKPAASAAEPTTDQSQNQQKHNSSNESIDDQSNDAYAEVNTKLRQEPVTYECTDEADEQIADQSEAAALHHPARQIAGYDADNDDYEQTLIG